MTAPDRDRNTLLHFLAAGDNLVEIDSAIKSGADINAQNNIGQTPLHVAYKKGKLATALHLIGRGANVNLRDGNDHLPFDLDSSSL